MDTPEIRDPRYANVKVKDAIVDRLRRLFRRRPDSGADRTGAVVHLYWQNDRYRIFADTSGEPLSRRGYRKIPLAAPMQETLAAALIMATGWTGEETLLNPMCGSGTLAIEAALIARRRPPGILRENFGFLHLRGFDDDLWQQLRLQVRKQERKEFPGRIIATDISPEAVRAAGINAARAKMGRCIRFHVCDYALTPAPPAPGVVVMNPPYGQRLGENDDLAGLYEEMGDFLKTRCRGYRGYIFTANFELAKKVGLRTKRRLIFYNGELESRLLEDELYEGSRKRFLPGAATTPENAGVHGGGDGRRAAEPESRPGKGPGDARRERTPHGSGARKHGRHNHPAKPIPRRRGEKRERAEGATSPRHKQGKEK